MIKEKLVKLSNSCGLAHITQAKDTACGYLNEFMQTKNLYGNCVMGVLNGKSDKTIMLEAHCDEVGFIVKSVDDKGFIKVDSIGKTDARVLPSKPVIVHAKEKLKGVFGSVPPHLKGKEDLPVDLESLFIDTGLGEKTRDIVKPGDIVTFDSKAFEIGENCVCGKSLDNRAGVATLIRTAELLQNKELPYNVCFLLSWNEELGLRGAKTATYELMPDCAIAVDVSFGNMPNLSGDDTRKLGDGTMIGISPLLCRKITNKLFELADKFDIKHTQEVMSGKTGTDADVITETGKGVPCGLLSIPLRSMHSCYETVDVRDVEATAQLLSSFVLSGGVFGD